MNVVRLPPRSEGQWCDAIRGRLLLALDYGDGERIIEPCCHGLNAAGVEMLRGYQISGPSRLGHRNPWRLFQVKRIAQARVLSASFKERRADSIERDPDIVRPHCRLDDD